MESKYSADHSPVLRFPLVTYAQISISVYSYIKNVDKTQRTKKHAWLNRNYDEEIKIKTQIVNIRLCTIYLEKDTKVNK